MASSPNSAFDFSLLQLGAATLEGFEVPGTVSFGGDQKLVVNEFVGTDKRQVSTLGSQPRQIGWQGIFLYDSALSRAAYFDQKRKLGDPLSFLWGDYNFIVVIDRFYYDPQSAYHIPYQISLTVVQDLSFVSAGLPPSSDTVLQAITSVLGDLITFANSLVAAVAIVEALRSGNVNSILGSINSLSTVVLGAGALLPNLPVATLQQYAAQAAFIESQAKGLAALLDQSKSNSPVTEALQIASGAAILGSLLGQLFKPATTSSITVVKDNLFRVASNFYKDVNAWTNIADANGLADARVVGLTTIKLPPVNGQLPQQSGIPGTVYETGPVELRPAESIRGR